MEPRAGIQAGDGLSPGPPQWREERRRESQGGRSWEEGQPGGRCPNTTVAQAPGPKGVPGVCSRVRERPLRVQTGWSQRIPPNPEGGPCVSGRRGGGNYSPARAGGSAPPRGPSRIRQRACRAHREPGCFRLTGLGRDTPTPTPGQSPACGGGSVRCKMGSAAWPGASRGRGLPSVSHHPPTGLRGRQLRPPPTTTSCSPGSAG